MENQKEIMEDAFELLERLSTAIIVADGEGEVMQSLVDDIDEERRRGKVMLALIGGLTLTTLCLGAKVFPDEAKAVKATGALAYEYAKNMIKKVTK